MSNIVEMEANAKAGGMLSYAKEMPEVEEKQSALYKRLFFGAAIILLASFGLNIVCVWMVADASTPAQDRDLVMTFTGPSQQSLTATTATATTTGENVRRKWLDKACVREVYGEDFFASVAEHGWNILGSYFHVIKHDLENKLGQCLREKYKKYHKHGPYSSKGYCAAGQARYRPYDFNVYVCQHPSEHGDLINCVSGQNTRACEPESICKYFPDFCFGNASANPMEVAPAHIRDPYKAWLRKIAQQQQNKQTSTATAKQTDESWGNVDWYATAQNAQNVASYNAPTAYNTAANVASWTYSWR